MAEVALKIQSHDYDEFCSENKNESVGIKEGCVSNLWGNVVANEMTRFITSETEECPSFENSVWGQKAERYRPRAWDSYQSIELDSWRFSHPLRTGQRYYQLYLNFLDTVPKSCWQDEENEQD